MQKVINSKQVLKHQQKKVITKFNKYLNALKTYADKIFTKLSFFLSLKQIIPHIKNTSLNEKTQTYACIKVKKSF